MRKKITLGTLPLMDSAGVFDGSGFSNKICVDCDAIRDEMNKKVGIYDQVCVGELCDAVFEDSEATIKRFIEIKIKRGCPVQPWMTERLVYNLLTNK